jgi:hypothetical protein
MRFSNDCLRLLIINACTFYTHHNDYIVNAHDDDDGHSYDGNDDYDDYVDE